MFGFFKEIFQSPVAASLAVIGTVGAIILLGLLGRWLLGLRRGKGKPLEHAFFDSSNRAVFEKALADSVVKEVFSKLSKQHYTRAEVEAILSGLGQVQSVLRSDVADLKRTILIDGAGPQEELRGALGRIQDQRGKAADALLAIEDEVRKLRRSLLAEDALIAAAPAPAVATAPEPSAEPVASVVETPPANQ